jgi:hypothetical protein
LKILGPVPSRSIGIVREVSIFCGCSDIGVAGMVFAGVDGVVFIVFWPERKN